MTPRTTVEGADRQAQPSPLTRRVLITGLPVFFMNLGFACVRIGHVPGHERGQQPSKLHRVSR